MSARSILWVAAVLLLVSALALSFELGRNRAGFSLLDQRHERAAFEEELTAREATIETLERELAIAKTSNQIDSESNAAVKATLGELEARLQEQEEELAFYRGIVSPDDGLAGLRIQSVGVAPDPAGDTITLQVLLVQAIVSDKPVSGELRASLSGNQKGQAMAYTLGELGAGDESGAIHFEFRYFQSLDTALVLPAGFEPVELELEVWPLSPQGETIVQTFPWDGLEG